MYLDKLRLDGRTAFVTGGAQGIGLATAEALAEAGAEVTIADRDGAALQRSGAGSRRRARSRGARRPYSSPSSLGWV